MHEKVNDYSWVHMNSSQWSQRIIWWCCRQLHLCEKMASSSSSEKVLSCFVCHNIFEDHVLTCTHNICETCLKTFRESTGSWECPFCNRRPLRVESPMNMVFRYLWETFLPWRSSQCSLHHSELKLFCEDDKKLMCLVCRDSKRHKNHYFSPLNEAAIEHKVSIEYAFHLLHLSVLQSVVAL